MATEYKTVAVGRRQLSSATRHLDQKVEQKLEAGWELRGDVQMTVTTKPHPGRFSSGSDKVLKYTLVQTLVRNDRER